MAECASQQAHTDRALGDTMACVHAGQSTVASTRCILRIHGQSGDAHLLHDLPAHPVLVWVYKRGPSVCQAVRLNWCDI